MVHLVYCNNAGKKGERVLDKILSGKKDNDRARCSREKNSPQSSFCG